jgi:hypothetical protein
MSINEFGRGHGLPDANHDRQVERWHSRERWRNNEDPQCIER